MVVESNSSRNPPWRPAALSARAQEVQQVYARTRVCRPIEFANVVTDKLLDLATSHLLPFVSSADDEDGKLVVDPLPPMKLENVFNLALPDGEGRGEVGLDEAIRKVLRYSVNTWRDGFMDKLYASTDPVGVTSDLLLSVLNTNARIVHSQRIIVHDAWD